MTQFYFRIVNFIRTKKLLFLGIVIFAIYFWDRLFRIRLPRDIPFQSNIFILLFLLITCCVYIFILYRIFYPPKSLWMLQTLTREFKVFIESFQVLDQHIKNIPSIKKFLGPQLIKFASMVEPYNWYQFTKYRRRLLIYFFLPSYLLLFVFIIDVFWFHQFKYVYYFIPLTMASIILPYILYSIRVYINSEVNVWSSEISSVCVSPFDSSVIPLDDYEEYDDPLRSMELTFEQFMPHHINQMYLETENYEYTIFPENKYFIDIMAKHNINKNEILPNDLFEIICEPFKKIINDLTKVGFILKCYEAVMYLGDNALIKKMKWFKVILYGGYIICWVYILCRTIYDYDLGLLVKELNNILEYIEEPFSQEYSLKDDV